MSSEPDADLLVLGASFAGLAVVRRLLRRRPRFAGRIAVVDRAPRHVYLPLVHEWLTGRIPPPPAEIDVAGYLSKFAAVRFVEGEVASFDPRAGRVQLACGRSLAAPIVVVALGSVLAPPADLPGAEHLLRYKLPAEARSARARVEELLARRRARIVVVGGGISGVELAAELAFAARRRGRPEHQVRLVVRGERVLPAFARHVAARAEQALSALGVGIERYTTCVGAEPGAVRLAGTAGARAPTCDAAFWAGGVRPAPVLARVGLARAADGGVLCDPTLRAATTGGGGATVFACGDGASVVGEDGVPWPTMRRAVECLWQARVVAHNVAATFEAGAALAPARHRLRTTFPYGVSLGDRSLVVAGEAVLDRPALGIGLRRLLLRLYRRRFSPV